MKETLTCPVCGNTVTSSRTSNLDDSKIIGCKQCKLKSALAEWRLVTPEAEEPTPAPPAELPEPEPEHRSFRMSWGKPTQNRSFAQREIESAKSIGLLLLPALCLIGCCGICSGIVHWTDDNDQSYVIPTTPEGKAEYFHDAYNDPKKLKQALDSGWLEEHPDDYIERLRREQGN